MTKPTPPTSPPSRFLGWLFPLGALAAVVTAAATLAADQTATGSIEGRIFNGRNAEYVNHARVSVVGTALTTLTDDTGFYRLANVPAGQAKVVASYTGYASEMQSVAVSAGAIATANFKFAGGAQTATDRDAAIQLDTFTVTAERQMAGSAIAINEQRFAANMKSVLSTDEFGDIPDGNVGEFIKFMPGVSVTGNGGDMRYISLNGAPPQYVPITVGGFDLASAASSSTARQVELEQVSINNVSRIEINQSPTPESPGSALAGSVNLVPRSAFERAHPEIVASAYVMMRDSDKSLKKTPGPLNKDTHKIRSGFDFTAIVPVTQNFGFTVSASNSTQFTPQDGMQNTWRGPDAGTNGSSLPDTTPDKPYLSDYQINGTTKFTYRDSAAISLDYRFTRKDRVSLSFQYSFFDAEFVNRSMVFSVNRVAPTDFSLSYTHGAITAGQVTIGQDGRDKSGTTYTPTLVYRHEGEIWRSEVGLGLSNASNHYRDIDKGYFRGANAILRNVTINFDDIWYLRPGRISVLDASGAPVDPYNLSSYSLTSFSSGPIDSSDTRKTAYANIRRDFGLRVPVSIKAGIDARRSERDLHQGGLGSFGVNYLGTGPNDFAVDASSSRRSLPFGFPATQWINPFSMLELYKSEPASFSAPDENNRYRTFVGNSKWAQETVSSAYLMGDTRLFNSRLRLVGGIRAEQTNVKAQGPLTDPTRNFQRDARGNVLRDAAGKPLPIAMAALGVSQLTFLERQQKADKEYLRWFPSINATYNLTENLVARAAYYYSVGRPDYNQYAGGITLPDTEQPPSPTTNRILVNNVGIKAWTAHSIRVGLDYYFKKGGVLSAGAFRRDFYNFFGGTVFPATPEFLAFYDLDPETYGAYYVSTQQNLTTPVRIEGLNVDYRQPLVFLPNWARGVQVFANVSSQYISVDPSANFTGISSFTPRTYSWGVSLTRPKYSLNVNWNYKGPARRLLLVNRSGDPNNYSYISKQMLIDATAEYRMTKQLSLFANLRNLNDAFDDAKIYGPSTPAVARLRYRNDYGSVWTFGVRGRF